MVTSFSGTEWILANDPQPGVQDNSHKGSFIPSFGDALYPRYHVPIASVGHGSTSVRQWLPAATPIEVMPTTTRYVRTNPDGTLVSDGTLFNGMMLRIHQLGPTVFAHSSGTRESPTPTSPPNTTSTPPPTAG